MLRFLPLIISILVIAFSTAVSVPDSPFLLNGLTQKDISDMFSTAITPAPFTFSIWSVIYLSWIILSIAIIMGKVSLTQKQTIALIGSMLLTSIWLVPWSYLWIGVALLVMFVLLGTLWYLFSLVKKDGGFVRGVVELFMGWIHIATFVNLAVWLKYAGITGGGIEQLYYGIAVLTFAFCATLFFQLKHRTFIVSLVYLWASLGIFFGQPQTALTLFLVIYAIGIVGVMLSQKIRH